MGSQPLPLRNALGPVTCLFHKFNASEGLCDPLTRATKSQSRSTAMGGWPCGSGSGPPLTAASADEDGGGSNDPTVALGGGSVTPL